MISLLLIPMRLLRMLQLRFQHITRPTGPRERLLRRCRGHRSVARREASEHIYKTPH
jgi:hypothetical protein